MTVGEMIRMLEKYPEDIEVLNGWSVDNDTFLEDDWYLVDAVPNDVGFMLSHPYLTAREKAIEKVYLYFDGS